MQRFGGAACYAGRPHDRIGSIHEPIRVVPIGSCVDPTPAVRAAKRRPQIDPRSASICCNSARATKKGPPDLLPS